MPVELAAEEKTSRTRDIHSKAFTPGLTPGVLCRFLDRVWMGISLAVLQVTLQLRGKSGLLASQCLKLRELNS